MEHYIRNYNGIHETKRPPLFRSVGNILRGGWKLFFLIIWLSFASQHNFLGRFLLWFVVVCILGCLWLEEKGKTLKKNRILRNSIQWRRPGNPDSHGILLYHWWAGNIGLSIHSLPSVRASHAEDRLTRLDHSWWKLIDGSHSPCPPS